MNNYVLEVVLLNLKAVSKIKCQKMCFWKRFAFVHAIWRNASRFDCEVKTYLDHRLLGGWIEGFCPQHWSPRYSDHSRLCFARRGHTDYLVHPWVVVTRDTLVYRIVDDPAPREGQY